MKGSQLKPTVLNNVLPTRLSSWVELHRAYRERPLPNWYFLLGANNTFSFQCTAEQSGHF